MTEPARSSAGRRPAVPAFPAAWATLLALLAPLALGAAGCADGNPRTDLPDILLVSIDTLRADRLSCYGHSEATTPGLDRLAAEGLVFEQVLAPSAHTAPSHMSLFTGLDPAAHGVHNVSNLDAPVPRLAESVPLFVERLRDAGYVTAAFTDRGNLLPEMGFDRGFDHLDAQYEGLPRKIKRCAQWLRAQNPDRPLFLFFHTYQVHAPYLPSARQRGRFTDPDYRGVFRHRLDELARLSPQAAFARAGEFLDRDSDLGADDLAFLSGLYDEGVATADEHLAELWGVWHELRGLDQTLLVVTSDHGEALGEHGVLGHGRGLWTEHLRVPLILRGPGVRAGRVPQPVSLTGLAPTLLALLELPALDAQVGSFVDQLRAPGAGAAHVGAAGPAVSQVVGGARASRIESAQQGGLRLMRREAAGEIQDILFDLASDPRETRDATAAWRAEAASLGALLDRRWADSELRYLHGGAQAGASLRSQGPGGTERARELRGLGYLGDD